MSKKSKKSIEATTFETVTLLGQETDTLVALKEAVGVQTVEATPNTKVKAHYTPHNVLTVVYAEISRLASDLTIFSTRKQLRSLSKMVSFAQRIEMHVHLNDYTFKRKDLLAIAGEVDDPALEILLGGYFPKWE